MKKNVGGLIKVYYAFGYWWSREVLSGSLVDIGGRRKF
jgi:hypothetical protein